MFLSREQYGRLLLGKSVNVLGINIRCFTIKEVIDNIGIEKYDSTLSLLNVDKLELMMFLKQDLDAYSLIQLHMLIPGLDETLADLIQIFLDPKEVVWNKESFEIKVVSKDGSSILLNQKNYRNFFRSIADIYNVSLNETEEDVVFGTESAKYNWRRYQHALREGRRRDAAYNSCIDLFSVISSVINIGKLYKYDNIENLTIFQLYDSFYRLDHYETCKSIDKIRTSGMIDTSKINLPDIHWYDIIKNVSNGNVFET